MDVEHVYTEHRTMLVRMLQSRGASLEEAEDSVQTAFLRLCARDTDEMSPAHTKNYVALVVLNVWRDSLRRRGRQPPLSGSVEPDCMPATCGDPLRACVAHERRDGVRATVDTLTPCRKNAIIMQYYGGHSSSVVGAALGVSPRTIVSRTRDAKAVLAKRLGAWQ